MDSVLCSQWLDAERIIVMLIGEPDVHYFELSHLRRVGYPHG